MLLDRVWINQLFTGVNKLNFKFKKLPARDSENCTIIEFFNIYLKFYLKYFGAFLN
jgi:hypothetical protein